MQSLGVEVGGDWNVATGLYHSHTPELAAAFRNRVAEVGRSVQRSPITNIWSSGLRPASAAR
jgi:broad specificity phosphatase PhoE